MSTWSTAMLPPKFTVMSWVRKTSLSSESLGFVSLTRAAEAKRLSLGSQLRIKNGHMNGMPGTSNSNNNV